MEDNFTQRYIFKLLMFVALISGLVFFYVDHFDFIAASIEYSKINVSNIGYMLLRIFGGILLPMVFIVPSLFEFGRIKLARLFLILYGAFHIVTVSWMIYFVIVNPYIELFDANKVSEFLNANYFVYPTVFWDNNSFASVFLTLLYGFMAIYTGIHFDKDKSLVKTLVCLLFTCRIVFPLLFNIFGQGRFFSEAWLSYNIYEIIGQLAFTIAIVYAGKNNLTWVELVWDQLAFVETDDVGLKNSDETEENGNSEQ